mmetsp:Transcript_53967/g.63108  ORF Transcript_53967/g.63108 Transcript_53967/m.63108 type:complete len:110 (-) Transcript_53967:1167-1496(-)
MIFYQKNCHPPPDVTPNCSGLAPNKRDQTINDADCHNVNNHEELMFQGVEVEQYPSSNSGNLDLHFTEVVHQEPVTRKRANANANANTPIIPDFMCVAIGTNYDRIDKW